MSRIISARDLVRLSAEQFMISPPELYGRAHYARFARSLTFKALRELCPHMSLPEIGRLFDGRDHTTVRAGVTRAEVLIRTDPQAADAWRKLVETAQADEATRLDRRIAEAEAQVAALRAARAALTARQTDPLGAGA
jgi:hypothetical protein